MRTNVGGTRLVTEWLGLVILVLAVLPAAPAGAADFLVDTAADNPALTACTAAAGDCSLRGAITAANGNAQDDVITLPDGVYLVNTAGTGEDANADGDLDVTSVIRIDGQSGTGAVVDGAADERVFHVTAGGDLTLNDLTVRNGNAALAGEDGGGILAAGALTLNRCNVSGNTAQDSGGGVFSQGSAAVTDTLISSNTAGGHGGGLTNDNGGLTLNRSAINGNKASGNGGGLYLDNLQTVDVVNCTFGRNESDQSGGGIAFNNGTLNLSFISVAENVADFDANGTGDGGGLWTNAAGTNLKNSIIYYNDDKGHQADQISGVYTPWPDNLLATNPWFWPLGMYGGPTPTYALDWGSPARDYTNDCTTVTGAAVLVDQRGVSRPHGSRCDLGAYEFVTQPGSGDDGSGGGGGGGCFVDTAGPERKVLR